MAVLGIPFDLTTSGRSGARFGPSALREASTQLAWGSVWPWGFDPFDRLSVVDCGDVPFRRGRGAQMYDVATELARRVIGAGAQTIMMGGDHSSTYAMLKAHAERHGALGLVQFDAHRDTQESEFLDHGTFVHHAMQEGLIDPKRPIQIGIRTFYDDDDDITVLYRDWLHVHSAAGMQARIKEVVGTGPAYLTIDIDSLDPGFAPGTGTPVVDGLAPNDIIRFLRNCGDLDFVGMDLVEVAPPYDPAGITALRGASLILGYICANAAKKGVLAMGFRVAIIEFAHESNTFAVNKADIQVFRNSRYFCGAEVVQHLHATNSEIGGAIDFAEQMGWKLVPIVAAHANPGGPVTEAARREITDETLCRLTENGPFDGAFIALHGAMVTESDQDGESQFLRVVRKVLGPAVLIAVTLDPHGNIFDEMVDHVQIAVSYRTSDRHSTSTDAGRVRRWAHNQ